MKRSWQINSLEGGDIEYLVNELNQMTYPLCTGFRYEGFLFLNISNNRQLPRFSTRYMLVREFDRMPIGELELSGSDTPQLRRRILALLSSEPDDIYDLPIEVRWQESFLHRCPCCSRV